MTSLFGRVAVRRGVLEGFVAEPAFANHPRSPRSPGMRRRSTTGRQLSKSTPRSLSPAGRRRLLRLQFRRADFAQLALQWSTDAHPGRRR